MRSRSRWRGVVVFGNVCACVIFITKFFVLCVHCLFDCFVGSARLSLSLSLYGRGRFSTGKNRLQCQLCFMPQFAADAAAAAGDGGEQQADAAKHAIKICNEHSGQAGWRVGKQAGRRRAASNECDFQLKFINQMFFYSLFFSPFRGANVEIDENGISNYSKRNK